MKERVEALLRDLGYTDSEIKVYLSLLEIGSTSKGPLVRETGVSSSKIYEILDRLIRKGLVSSAVKNKVKFYSAAPPLSIMDLLKEREEELKRMETELEETLPFFKTMGKMSSKGTDAEIYRGWRGMLTVYNEIIDSLPVGGEYMVFGASRGEDEERVRSFYTKFNVKVMKKNIVARIIFNEKARGNIPNITKNAKVRYIDHTTPSEILIYGNKTLIVILEKEPLVIAIESESVSRSFRMYFDVMWKVAKK